MNKFGEKIVKLRYVILVVALLLLIPSFFGYVNTRVNYDLLSYLPEDIETMKGQDILVDEFGTGAFSMFVVEGMEDKDIVSLKEQISNVDHVEKVVWYDSLLDISIPKDMLPDKIYDAFNNGDCTLMFIIFDETTSADSTMEAIDEIRSIANEQCFLSGMSAIVTDTKHLVEQEMMLYVGIAVLCSFIILCLTMDSFLIPIFFLLSIGMAIIYNLGSNLFLGEISYVTKALSAVLQLGVTMDYSIFLWHSYREEIEHTSDHKEAMAQAIAKTLTSVTGSSVTTIAGFIALCFMTFTLGMDLGIVMAKGVLLGVICCVTVLPSLILVFDKAIEKTAHRPLVPKPDRLSKFVTKHYIPIILLFLVLLVPAIYGNSHVPVYYNLDSTLPESLQSVSANTKLQEEFDMSSTHMLLLSSDIPSYEVNKMSKQIEDLGGVKAVIGIDTIIGSTIPADMVPSDIREILDDGTYKVLLVMSEYKVASDEVNAQCDGISSIIKSYDPNAMLVGEAPCTKDLITITDTDFKTVSAVSIILIFLIIALTFRSVVIPVILVAVIEFAIFINMSVPYFTNTAVPFIASIVIGTIQLGATVDYAILFTTRYKTERRAGVSKYDAITTAHMNCSQSVFVSALSFFAATIGVGFYSNIDMISSLCILMARGAIISMFVVLLVLPAMLMIFDRVILATSKTFRPVDGDTDKSVGRLQPRH
jgi:hypothetical protein